MTNAAEEQNKKKKKKKGRVDIETLYSFNLTDPQKRELQKMKNGKMGSDGLTKKDLMKAMKTLSKIVERDAEEQNVKQSQQMEGLEHPPTFVSKMTMPRQVKDSEAHARLPSPSRTRKFAESESVQVSEPSEHGNCESPWEEPPKLVESSGSSSAQIVPAPAPCDSQKSCVPEEQPKKSFQRGTAQNVQDMWHAHPITFWDVTTYLDDLTSEESTTEDEVSDETEADDEASDVGETKQEEFQEWYDFLDAVSILGKSAISMITQLTPNAPVHGTILNAKAEAFALSSYLCCSARQKPAKDLLQSTTVRRKVPQWPNPTH